MLSLSYTKVDKSIVDILVATINALVDGNGRPIVELLSYIAKIHCRKWLFHMFDIVVV